MPNRILKDSIRTSDTIDTLSEEVENCFYRLLVTADDFGRMDARLPILRANCYPLRLATIDDAEMARRVNALIDAGLVWLYESNGRPYLQVTTWERHQQRRASHSKFPDPPTDASTCKHLLSSDSNDKQMSPNSNTNPNAKRESDCPSDASAPEGTTPVKRTKRDEQNAVRSAITEAFSSNTGIRCPPADTDAQKKEVGELWWTPVRRLAELVEWDAGAGQNLVRLVVQRMKQDRLTISSPKSILNVARSLAPGLLNSGQVEALDVGMGQFGMRTGPPNVNLEHIGGVF
jgi:hypothetical protein